jgi:VanZ family protein
MLVIFTASADGNSSRHSSLYFDPLMHWLFPHMTQGKIDSIHYIFRKCCHLTEYAILALLCRHAIRRSMKNTAPAWRWPEAGLALAIVFLYSASDELHQVFVPTRTGQISDVLVDFSGGVIGLTLLRLGKKFFRRVKK